MMTPSKLPGKSTDDPEDTNDVGVIADLEELVLERINDDSQSTGSICKQTPKFLRVLGLLNSMTGNEYHEEKARLVEAAEFLFDGCMDNLNSGRYEERYYKGIAKSIAAMRLLNSYRADSMQKQYDELRK